MNLIKKTAVLAMTGLMFGLVGCATSSEVSSNTDNQERNIDKELKEISASAEAKKLLATESDETVLREKLVCKREKKIGTHFKKKVCRTQAEMDAMREAAKRETNSVQRVRDYDSAN